MDLSTLRASLQGTSFQVLLLYCESISNLQEAIQDVASSLLVARARVSLIPGKVDAMSAYADDAFHNSPAFFELVLKLGWPFLER